MITFRPFDAAPIGVPAEVPEIPAAVFRRRHARLLAAFEGAGYDALAIYADREHSANLAWLTGFAPRFEEALLLLVPGRTPTLLVGNECLAYAPLQLGIDVDLRLYQPFSLPGQDRSRSLNLEDGLLLADGELRAEPTVLDPALMERVAVRRQQMQRLGFQLHPDVLPLGNLAGVFHPFLLEPTLVAHLS